ncbi:MAG: hypothetical protein ACI9S8_002881 [Chlamydiales bacterium]|jgi:hypothetical protein
MSKEQEQKLLATLYDRLQDIVTYNPSEGREAQFEKGKTLVQFAKNEAIDPAEYDNAVSPSNPNGLANTAEAFSRLIDSVPAAQGVHASTEKSVDTNYGTIVNGANSTEQPDPVALENYGKAYDYLYAIATIKDFTGAEQTVTNETPRYTNYKLKKSAYYKALSAYRIAFNNYDLIQVKDQREWQANAPALEATLDNAWSDFRSGDASYIEQAIQVMDTSINSAVRNVLEEAKKTYATTSLPSNIPGTPNWHQSYATPNNWSSESGTDNFTELVLKSGNLNKTESSEFSSYGAGANWSGGLWSVGGDVSGSSGETKSHMDSDDFELSMKIAVVQVERPWLNGEIFTMKGWNLGAGFPAGSISDGTLKDTMNKSMALITTGLVVARDIQIKCDFSTEDKTHVESSVSGSTSVGWGPFKISGHYSHSSSKDTFNSTYENGVLKIPGMQILGYVNWIVPNSPPLSVGVKAAAGNTAE